jgi:hypothetical protein
LAYSVLVRRRPEIAFGRADGDGCAYRHYNGKEDAGYSFEYVFVHNLS